MNLDFDTIELQEIIGRGSFGEVYRGIYKPTQEEIAIKIVDLDSAEDEIEIIQQEISILKKCSSPYIIKYYGSFIRGTKLWLVMEFMAGGSVKDHLDLFGPLKEVRFLREFGHCKTE
jgi:serine/threonine-protein kinase 24/25/MST4